MAERVRRFRVKENGRWDVQAGDVGEYANNGVRAGCYWLKNAKWSGDGVWHFEPHEIEELPTFAVGDAVRVKAGDWQRVPTVGVKLILQKIDGGLARLEGCLCADVENLEPWNDAEEWNGTAWVAKKPECPRINAWEAMVKTFFTAESPKPDSVPKPAIVCLREDGKIRYGTITPFGSTNEAFRKAEEWVALYPGKEYVVLQEKGSKRVEPVKPIFQAGDVLKAVRENASWGGTQIPKGALVVYSHFAMHPVHGQDINIKYLEDRLLLVGSADFVKVGHVES